MPRLQPLTNEYGERIRTDWCVFSLGVGAWTGRSALTSATTTTLSHFATAGTRRTRVSEMRLSVPERMGRVRHDARFSGGMLTRRGDGTLSATRG